MTTRYHDANGKVFRGKGRNLGTESVARCELSAQSFCKTHTSIKVL